MNNKNNYPQRIICLTEESVEILYALGEEDRIAGVSAFAKRPPEVVEKKTVSLFTTSNYKKIDELKPDLIIGHSDIQKDIARDLIERGHNVYIANHRTIDEIKDYIGFISRLVYKEDQGNELIQKVEKQIEYAQLFTKDLDVKPRVYFEEWDDPMISSINWVSQLIELCGGENIFSDRSHGVLARERFVTTDEVIAANPNIIFCCWCGKKAKLDKVRERSGWKNIDAITNNQVFELAPEVFLQPGLAPLLDGINILVEYFKSWDQEKR